MNRMVNDKRMSWTTKAYAKINLGLHVLERLENGYHRIETGFCFIDWADRLVMRPSERHHLELSDPGIPADERNLISKAYRRFETYVGLSRPYAFQVTKQIPAGAGLGGGSADAAAALRLLNDAEGTGMSTPDLMELSRGLGADVPFFIAGTPGIGTGLGQDVEPLPIQPDAWIVTVWPGFESSTAEAYRDCEPNPDPIAPLRRILIEEPVEEWAIMLENDLEPPVIARHDRVGLMKAQMLEFGAEYASMSGSGSSVYGLFDQEMVAIHAHDSLSNLGYRTCLTEPGFIPDLRISVKGG